MNSKRTIVGRLVPLGLFFTSMVLASPLYAANDCPNTRWQASHGRTCANLGLDSNRPICAGGQFATLCDDTRNQIRTCRSNLVCDTPAHGGASWNNAPDYLPRWSPPLRPGFAGNPSWNGAGNNYLYYRGKQFHCTEWNYRTKRPCKSGRINEDCRGGC